MLVCAFLFGAFCAGVIALATFGAREIDSYWEGYRQARVDAILARKKHGGKKHGQTRT